MDTRLNLEDLFDLDNMAFAVEISLAVARNDTSYVQIKNEQDLYRLPINREIFDMILKQGLDYIIYFTSCNIMM